MNTSTKIAIAAGASVCIACGTLMWALCALTRELDDADAAMWDYSRQQRRYRGFEHPISED